MPIILDPLAKVPVDNEASVFTQVSVAIGEPVKLAGVDTEDSELRSRITYLLSLHKYEPEQEPGGAKEPAFAK